MKILWIPHTGWHIPQRSHIFCRALAERHEVHVTDLIADFHNWYDYLSWRYLKNFSYRLYRDGEITVHGVPRISPAIFSSTLRHLNSDIFSQLVQLIIDRYQIEVVVGTFVVPPPKAPRLVFDLFDDNVSYWRSIGSPYADEIEQNEQAYFEQSNAVVAISSVLMDKARQCGTGDNLYYIPNGVNLDQYGKKNKKNIRDKFNISGALVGSVGNYDRPSELNRIIGAAKLMKSEDVTFLIAGRGSALPQAKKQVKSQDISNVIFMGYLPSNKAIEVMTTLDVGLCPYDKTPMDDARSPMRLLAYSAASVPVVCTDLKSVRSIGFPNVVLVDDSATAMVAGIKQALQFPKVRPPQIEAYDINKLVTKYEMILQG
ncbi:MAG: hypothetical protein B6242_08815 [Anaerolineaceae bacterium 4572_78]|nr:MAG: hypothetical protein B6242_08815 [Anaerolineaceae bacterium 4572_78]